MKSKIFLFGLMSIFLFSLNGCKSKESAYKAAFDAATEREIPEEVVVVEEVTPVEKTQPTSASSAITQKEKVTPVNYSGMEKFSVVVGSFQNRTNATSLKERMEAQGYKAFLAQNERGMYRVIIATFKNKIEAADLRDQVKKRYYPNEFQDSWILEQDN